MKKIKSILLLFIIASFASCFPFGEEYKEVINNYYLLRSENGNYFLTKGKADVDGGGLINGTIKEIGWNEQYILANRHSTFRGDVDGWMFINTKTDEITGPFSEEEYINKRKETETSELKTYEPSDAWKLLK